MSTILLICLVVFAILGHGYLWVDITNTFHALSWPRKIIDGVTLVCLALFVLLPPLYVFFWDNLVVALSSSTSSSIWLKSYFYLCAGWGAAKVTLNAIYRYTSNSPRTLVDWRQEDLDVAAHIDKSQLVGRLPQLLGKVPGNEVFQLTVDYKRLAIPLLNIRHEGIRIAHISDLHMTGRIGPQWYETVANQVNQLEADVIAVTGDIIENESCWPWLANSLGRLRAKYGVYFVLGNHDFYINSQQTTQLLQEQGLICLSQRWIETHWNDAPVILAGNERPWAPEVVDLSDTPTKDELQLPLRLFLLHTPDQFAWACEQQADLALAGHTHGGQIRFPILGPIVCPSRFGTRYACGVFQRGNTVMHVSRGIAGKTPLRWNCLPEITLIELVRS